ncbi:hypothetical protein [Bacterioplanoides sp.]|uniref:hypothetical protein n=1 Tax=Bacterioplanoides sp. TaxID=2066072 RepID=UPI003B5A4F34
MVLRPFSGLLHCFTLILTLGLSACSGEGSSTPTSGSADPATTVDLGSAPYPAKPGITALNSEFVGNKKPYQIRPLTPGKIQTSPLVGLSGVLDGSNKARAFTLQLPQASVELLHAPDPGGDTTEIYTNDGSISVFRDVQGLLYRHSSSGQEQISTERVADDKFWFSKDQKYLLFISESENNRPSNLYSYALQNKELVLIDQGQSGEVSGDNRHSILTRPLVNSDGQVLFLKRAQHETSLSLYGLYVSDGTSHKLLASQVKPIQSGHGFRLTTDETSVVYQTQSDDRKYQLWLSKLDGAVPSQLSQGLDLDTELSNVMYLNTNTVIFQAGVALYKVSTDGSGLMKISGDKKVNNAIVADGKIFFSTLLRFGQDAEPETLYQIKSDGALVALNAGATDRAFRYQNLQYIKSINAVLYEKQQVAAATSYFQPVLTFLNGTTKVIDLGVMRGFSSLHYQYIPSAEGLFIQARYGSNPLSLSRFYVSDIDGENLVSITPTDAELPNHFPQIIDCWPGRGVWFSSLTALNKRCISLIATQGVLSRLPSGRVSLSLSMSLQL